MGEGDRIKAACLSEKTMVICHMLLQDTLCHITQDIIQIEQSLSTSNPNKLMKQDVPVTFSDDIQILPVLIYF